MGPDHFYGDDDIAEPICINATPPCWGNSSHLTWYEFFNDPLLAALIDQALVGNQELKILNEEIWIANNEVDARRGEYLPFFNLGASAGLDKASRFTRNGAVEEALEVAPGKAFPDPLPDFLVAANVSWEIDIWRKLRNARDAAAFRFLGTQDGRSYIVTRLVAEVAQSYYELLALDNQLQTLDITIQIQEQSLKVAEAKKAAGRGTELAVQRFQAEVRKNQSEKYLIEQEIIEIENKINFLLGRYPQPVERASQNYINLSVCTLNVGVPSQLLQNRPDIRQAERELQAAGLDVEVARARFYPSLDITAGLGYEAFNPRYLFVSPEALIYNVVGDLMMPVINRKAIKAAYRSANARQIQAVYEYQRAILNAYTEVVNQITKVDNYGQSIEIKKQQLAALEDSVDSANKLFQTARAEYVEVLLAQREMMEARMILIETKQKQLSALVNAYQALGGGSMPNGN
ncbi:MAG: efflux transporter outer membrane subunit [Planctomycetaceae bacterium]|nr:efflux transporter outer membrane subunit [Planctomycetaceae bacterium]